MQKHARARLLNVYLPFSVFNCQIDKTRLVSSFFLFFPSVIIYSISLINVHLLVILFSTHELAIAVQFLFEVNAIKRLEKDDNAYYPRQKEKRER